MPARNDVVIPKECLDLIPEFTKAQQKQVIMVMLYHINLSISRKPKFKLRIRNLGVAFNHGNRKETVINLKRRGYNKKAWKQQKKILELTQRKLLF